MIKNKVKISTVNHCQGERWLMKRKIEERIRDSE